MTAPLRDGVRAAARRARGQARRAAAARPRRTTPSSPRRSTSSRDEIERLHDADLRAPRRRGTRVQISRHPERPKTAGLPRTALHRRRRAARRPRLRRRRGDVRRARARSAAGAVAVLGHRKGTNTKENVRAQLRLARTPRASARRCASCGSPRSSACPLVTFLDTAGAYPGIEAEERGQAWAIAESLATAVGAAGPGRRRRHRRRRQRRRAGHRLRRPPDHARERVLLGHQPRDVRDDPVQGRRRRPRTSAVVPQDDRRRTSWSSASPTRSSRSRSAARTAIPRPCSRRSRGHSSARWPSFRVSDPDELVASRYERLRAIGVCSLEGA